MEPAWRLPVNPVHHLSASAGVLTFVGGAGDFDSDGRIRHPGDLARQIEGAVDAVAQAGGNLAFFKNGIARNENGLYAGFRVAPFDRGSRLALTQGFGSFAANGVGVSHGQVAAELAGKVVRRGLCRPIRFGHGVLGRLVPGADSF